MSTYDNIWIIYFFKCIKNISIKFKYYNGSAAKVGFFGMDDTDQKFTYIPDATDTASVFSGTVGTIKANIEGDIKNSGGNVILFSGPGTANYTGNVTGNLTGGDVFKTTAANSTSKVLDLKNGTNDTPIFTGNVTGNVTGDLNGVIRNSLGQVVLDNGSIGATPNFGGNVTGNVDGIVGGTTPAAGTFTGITSTGNITMTGNNGNKVFIKQF